MYWIVYLFRIVQRISNRWIWPLDSSWRPCDCATRSSNSRHCRPEWPPLSRRRSRRVPPLGKRRATICWSASVSAGLCTRNTDCPSGSVRPDDRPCCCDESGEDRIATTTTKAKSWMNESKTGYVPALEQSNLCFVYRRWWRNNPIKYSRVFRLKKIETDSDLLDVCFLFVPFFLFLSTNIFLFDFSKRTWLLCRMILMCCLAPGQMLWRTRSGWWYSGGGVAPTALVWRWQFYNTTSIQHRSFLPFWFAGYPSENKKSQQRAQRGEKQEVDPQLVRGKAPKERKKGKKIESKLFLSFFLSDRGGSSDRWLGNHNCWPATSSFFICGELEYIRSDYISTCNLLLAWFVQFQLISNESSAKFVSFFIH